MDRHVSAIVNARVQGREGLHRLSIAGEHFAEFERQAGEVQVNDDELDACGNLVIAPFVEPHIHLDAAMTAGEPRWNKSGTLFEGIECWAERKATLTHEDVISRAEVTLKLFARHGIQYVRTHVDITDLSLTALRAMLEARERMSDLIDLQIVAFPQEGLWSYPGACELMEEALKLGADVVGGIPHFELTRDYGVDSVKWLVELAQRSDRLIDVHCDEIDDSESRFLEILAAEALRYDYGARVTASHTCAMGSYNNAYCSRLFRLLEKSGLRFVSLPTENLHLQGRFDGYPKQRGLTRVPELLESGLKVAFGQDSICDPWYPLGNGNLLRTLDAGLHVGHMLGMEWVEQWLALVTDNAAAALELTGYALEPGHRARCAILQGDSPYEVLKGQMPVLASVRDGRTIIHRQPERLDSIMSLK